MYEVLSAKPEASRVRTKESSLQQPPWMPQENPIEPPAGSRLPTVVDSLGNAVSRATLLLRERTLLTECLLYAVALRQRLAVADVAALVDVVHGFALRTRGTGAGVVQVRATVRTRAMLRARISPWVMLKHHATVLLGITLHPPLGLGPEAIPQPVQVMIMALVLTSHPL
jgi:hypothetical protein